MRCQCVTCVILSALTFSLDLLNNAFWPPMFFLNCTCILVCIGIFLLLCENGSGIYYDIHIGTARMASNGSNCMLLKGPFEPIIWASSKRPHQLYPNIHSTEKRSPPGTNVHVVPTLSHLAWKMPLAYCRLLSSKTKTISKYIQNDIWTWVKWPR